MQSAINRLLLAGEVASSQPRAHAGEGVAGLLMFRIETQRSRVFLCSVRPAPLTLKEHSEVQVRLGVARVKGKGALKMLLRGVQVSRRTSARQERLPQQRVGARVALVKRNRSLQAAPRLCRL